MLNKLIDNNITTISFPAKLDTKAVSDFADELKEIINSSEAIVYDMKDVGFVSSMFIRYCISANNAENVNSFGLINVSPKIKLVFKISGLDVFVKDQQ
ncbi:MAG: STAS domain-containing protein [Candidatus Kapaibacterium sp.]